MAEEKMFLTGNEAAVLGARDAGAKIMFGYPITPASEILHGWIAATEKDNNLQYLQTEDEIAAGFGVVGATLAGTRAFTASAGPGHILMQDALAMAEALRLPFVGIMMQRGGPSTGTVNFSQQEVNLAIFGGNGNGLRLVYSASSVKEMYELTLQAFSDAWQYRFPTIVLGDGYLGKMKNTLNLERKISHPIDKPILNKENQTGHLRNCFSSEEALAKEIRLALTDWQKNKRVLAQAENFMTQDAKTLIIAHGLVAAATKDAILALRAQNQLIGLWRPITLNPIEILSLGEAAQRAEKIYIIESALDQLSRLIKYELANLKIKAPIIEISKPAEGFLAEEIVERIKNA
ncbi:MAG: ferredoxin oxidoreductase [Patescibacteria group bacterium]